MIDDELRAAARQVIDLCISRGLMVATAESCTGGMVAAALTEIPGSSAVVACGLVTYSNETKQTILGIPAALLQRYGAVSRMTAEAMAEGALRTCRADLVVAVTGIAGPCGGSAEKPIGLVHVAARKRSGASIHREERFGDVGRAEVRRRSVLAALALLQQLART